MHEGCGWWGEPGRMSKWRVMGRPPLSNNQTLQLRTQAAELSGVRGDSQRAGSDVGENLGFRERPGAKGIANGLVWGSAAAFPGG